MNMLPNDHHPGPRCSCRDCQRRYPEAQPSSELPDPHYNRADGVMELSPEQWGDVRIAFDRLNQRVIGLGKCLYDEQHGITAETRSGHEPGALRQFAVWAAGAACDDEYAPQMVEHIAEMAEDALYGSADIAGYPAGIGAGQPPLSTPDIAAIRAVIAEMIHVAADGDRDADWTADNCAQIDRWQVRLAEAVAGQPQGVSLLRAAITKEVRHGD